MKFIDYGNCDYVDVGEIRLMPTDAGFSKMVQQAIQCSLISSIKSTGPDGTWTERSIEWMKKVLQIYCS